jgi:Putative beta-barrel porin 2
MALNISTLWRLARNWVCLALAMLLIVGFATASFAQEPPLEGPRAGQLLAPPDARTPDGWLLYPTVRFTSLYSNNIFQSPTAPIATSALGLSPSVTAEITDGIHKTSLYGNFGTQYYPSHTALDTLDGQTGFIHTYAPVDDLILRVQGNYSHQTFSNPLTSGIPGAVTAPTSTLLPNGNTLLPNGTIVSPTGAVVGQGIPALSAGTATNVVNPVDIFTATGSVDKQFNRADLSFTTTVSRTEYQSQQFTPDYTAATFSGHGAIWLNPLLYVYSDAVDSTQFNSNAYRTVAGLGTGHVGELFNGVVYFGYQGSQEDSAGSSGGNVLGISVIYDPMEAWSIKAAVDQTVNNASQTGVSTVALSLPIPAPVLIAENTGTRITADTLQTTYRFSPQIATSARFSYTHIDYFNSTRLDNAWLADAFISYDMWWNLTLTWEYQYSSLTSNVPSMSAYRNMITMSALYRF